VEDHDPIAIDARWVLGIPLLITLGFVLVYLLVEVALGDSGHLTAILVIHLDEGLGLPTWWQQIQLAAAGVAALFAGAVHRRGRCPTVVRRRCGPPAPQPRRGHRVAGRGPMTGGPNR